MKPPDRRFADAGASAWKATRAARSVYKDIGNGIASAGIEYYLPLFFDATATLFDYLPPASVLALHGPIETAMTRFWNETNERYRFLSRDVTRPIVPPADLFLNAEGFFSRAKPIMDASRWLTLQIRAGTRTLKRFRCLRSSGAPKTRSAGCTHSPKPL